MSQVLQKLKAAAQARWIDMVSSSEPPTAVAAESQSIQLLPVASGKGGVGKTNIAVGLSVLASQRFHGSGKRVLLVDGDLGLPNTDLVLGIRPEKSLANFVDRSIDDLMDIVSPTRYPGLDFIAGAEEATLVLGNLYYQQRRSLMGKISRLNSSLVIFDLGASASKEILDFFAMSPSGIVVLNPEPTSIRDAYVFVKNALIRRLRQELESVPGAREEFDAVLDELEGNWRVVRERVSAMPASPFREIWNSTSACFRPMIIVNRVETFGEGLATAQKFTRDVEMLLGIKILYLGSILKDDAVSRAVKAQRPFVLTEPDAPASRCLHAIAKNLLDNKGMDLNRNFASFGRTLTARFTGKPY